MNRYFGLGEDVAQYECGEFAPEMLVRDGNGIGVPYVFDFDCIWDQGVDTLCMMLNWDIGEGKGIDQMDYIPEIGDGMGNDFLEWVPLYDEIKKVDYHAQNF